MIRQAIGDDEVKLTARSVKTQYCGLAECKVGTVRGAGVEVIDERRSSDYRGHAEILFETFPRPAPYEPVEAGPGATAERDYYTRQLELFVYYPDPDVPRDSWAGLPLGSS